MRWRQSDPDLAVVAAFLAGHLLERLVTPTGEGSAAANVLGGLLMSAPFALRRRRPLAFALLLTAGALVSDLISTPTDDLFASIVSLIVAGFALARHQEGRALWAPLLVVLGAVGAAAIAADPGDLVFVWLVVGGGVTGGRMVRSRARLTRELAERTHELDALREAGRRDAVLEERRRIARELHDVVAHTVSIMVVQAGGARRQLDRNPARALAALDQVDATGRETLAELDRLFGLLADASPAHGLRALPSLVDRTRDAGLSLTLDVTGEPRALDPGADLAAFRAVQEALTNTLKHGGPGATAHVAVAWHDDGVEIAVRDTGWGAAGTRGEGSRRGLEGMRERLEQHEGTLDAGPVPGGGFEVRARLPLSRREVAVA